MNRTSVLLSCVLLAAALVGPSHARAFCRMTTEQSVQSGQGVSACSTGGVPLAWERPCLSYMVDVRASQSLGLAAVEAAVDTSFETWRKVTCEGTPVDFQLTPLVSSTCRLAEFNTNGGNVNTVAFLEDWEDADGDPLDPAAFAITFVWHNPSTGEIFDADMLINEDLGPYAQCPPAGCPEGDPGPADLQNIVTHEVGHFFGVGHTEIDDETITMFPSANRTDTSKRDLAADDLAAMCAIYPPGSLTKSCNDAPIGGLDANCEDSSNGGGGNGGGGCSIQRSDSSGVLWAALSLGLGLLVRRRRSRHATRRACV